MSEFANRQVPRSSLDALLREIRGCNLCAAALPLGPRPVLRAAATARLMIVGQAPGTRVHETGIPWNDASGDRLRAWLGIERDAFYDESRIAIVPMGFCYPGVDRNGGERPPRPECARRWHPLLAPHLARVALTLLVGGYAQKYYLGGGRAPSMTETVRRWRDYAPGFLPLPHPSWRNTAWLRRNPWFEAEVVPALRARVAALLG